MSKITARHEKNIERIAFLLQKIISQCLALQQSLHDRLNGENIRSMITV